MNNGNALDLILSKYAGAYVEVAAADIRHLVCELQAENARLRALVHPAPATAEEWQWHDGLPPHPWDKDWFLAKLDNGDRVVLRALPEEWSYDFTTADETYFKASRIKQWLQLPDGSYIKYIPAPAAAPDGGQKCKNPDCVDGNVPVVEFADGIPYQAGEPCPDCTPAREAKCKEHCLFHNRSVTPADEPCSGFSESFLPSRQPELCSSCGHSRACHAAQTTADQEVAR